MVRRGGEASRRARDPAVASRPTNRRATGGDRRDGRYHALELPRSDADAEVRSRARRGLHDGAQARRADAAHGACDRRARRGGGSAGGGLLRRHRRCRRRPGDRGRDDVEPDRPQARLHRIDRGGQAPDGTVRRSGEEGLARARRERAVHRLRRRRSRGRRGGRNDVQVPQLGADLHLGQQISRPGRDLRGVHRRVHRGSSLRSRSRTGSPRARRSGP